MPRTATQIIEDMRQTVDALSDHHGATMHNSGSSAPILHVERLCKALTDDIAALCDAYDADRPTITTGNLSC